MLPYRAWSKRAAELGKAWASKLVNGALRRLQREHAALEQRVDTDAATRFAQPDWLYRRPSSPRGWRMNGS